MNVFGLGINGKIAGDFDLKPSRSTSKYILLH